MPRADVVGEALQVVAALTFCPCKGLASYDDVGEARSAAWSYRTPFEEVVRIADLVSFCPENVTVTIDDHKLKPVPGQEVFAHGPDRNRALDEVGGIQPASPGPTRR